LAVTHVPLRQYEPGGQQYGSVVVPQTRRGGQHPFGRQTHPSLQQVTRPSAVTQQCEFGGQHVDWPFGPTQHRDSGGQQ
jgi:hypothetical protein